MFLHKITQNSFNRNISLQTQFLFAIYKNILLPMRKVEMNRHKGHRSNPAVCMNNTQAFMFLLWFVLPLLLRWVTSVVTYLEFSRFFFSLRPQMMSVSVYLLRGTFSPRGTSISFCQEIKTNKTHIRLFIKHNWRFMSSTLRETSFSRFRFEHAVQMKVNVSWTDAGSVIRQIIHRTTSLQSPFMPTQWLTLK